MTPVGRSSTRRVGQHHDSMRHGGMKNFQDKVGFIWSVADLLRGDYKQSDYGKVILPLTVLRRLDCVLEPTKEKLFERAKALPPKANEKMRELMLCQAAGPGMTFYNTSRFNLLFFDDSERADQEGRHSHIIRPAAGTRGMLSVAQNYLREFNRNATLKVFGQELNPESYAICMSDTLGNKRNEIEDGTNHNPWKRLP